MGDVFGPAELVMQRSAHHLQNDAAAMCTHDDILPASDLFFSAVSDAELVRDSVLRMMDEA